MAGVARERSSRATLRPRVVVVRTVMPGFEPFHSERFTVEHIDQRDDPGDDFAYGRGLAEAWASNATLVSVESDLQVDDDLISALVDCPQPRCAWAYLVYAVSGIHNAPAYPFADDKGAWVSEGVEWATWAAPGFIKVTREARTAPLPVVHWQEVEQVTNQCAPGLWHIHWPAVEHYHR